MHFHPCVPVIIAPSVSTHVTVRDLLNTLSCYVVLKIFATTFHEGVLVFCVCVFVCQYSCFAHMHSSIKHSYNTVSWVWGHYKLSGTLDL